MAINNTGQRLRVVGEEDGVVYDTIEKGDGFNHRSKAQVENDKHYSQLIPTKGRFVKLMIAASHVAKVFKDEPSVMLAMIIMTEYISRDQNKILKDGKKYKPSDLARDMGVTRQTASSYFKKLQKSNMIAEMVLRNKRKVWVANPEFFTVSESLPRNVFRLFEKRGGNNEI